MNLLLWIPWRVVEAFELALSETSERFLQSSRVCEQGGRGQEETNERRTAVDTQDF